MGLTNDADRLGREMQVRRAAQKAAAAAAVQAQKQFMDKQKRHEENKRQGMI